MEKKERIFSREALRELDRRAVQEFGIPILVLMENAGRAVSDAARRMLKATGARGVFVLAGPGNNGGDGLVAARHLHNAGVSVAILLLAPRESYKDAVAIQLQIVDAMKLPVEVSTAGHAEFRDWLVDAGPDDLLIDAIFGTGLSRPVEGLPAEIIAAANHSGHPVLAIDIPSGLDADTGTALGIAIKATETISFCGSKKGFKTSAGREHTGHVTIADIGTPRELLQDLAEK